jgi:hypothetical protein
MEVTAMGAWQGRRHVVVVAAPTSGSRQEKMVAADGDEEKRARVWGSHDGEKAQSTHAELVLSYGG